MTTIRYFILTSLVLAALSSVAVADVNAHAGVIGFSSAGKYLAYEEYGTNDDQNDHSPYSYIYILTVDDNRLAVPRFAGEGRSVIKDGFQHRVYPKSVRNRLHRFGIIDGNLGSQVTQDLMMGDLNTDHPTERLRVAKNLPDEMPLHKNDLTVTLKRARLSRELCPGFDRDMFALEMTLKAANGRSTVLKRAGEDAEHVGCSDAYGIENLAAYRNKVAVLVADAANGAKEPNNRYFVVTGSLRRK